MQQPKQITSQRFISWTIVVIVILASLSAFTLLRTSHLKEVRHNLEALSVEDENYRRLDSCITLLYEVENNSRFFVVTLDSSYHRRYVLQLKTVSRLLTDFETVKRQSNPHLTDLIAAKRLLGKDFVDLRLRLDSLMTARLKTEVAESLSSRPTVKSVSKEISQTETKKLDTVVVVKSKEKKRLFKRIIDAINNKEEKEKITTYDQTTRQSKDSVSVSEASAISPDRDMDIANRLYQTQRKLNAAEEKLLATNSELLYSIQLALQSMKDREVDEARLVKHTLVSSSIIGLNDIGLITYLLLIFIVILAAVAIFNLLNLYKSEKTILEYAALTTETARKKGNFLAQMAHEIRTPLNSIIGFSQVIDTDKLDEQVKEEVTSIKNSSQHLLSLVNEILDFSKFESGNVDLLIHDFSPLSLLNDALEMLSVQAVKKDIVIFQQLDLEPSLNLKGDELRFRQVIINLITNAIKYTEKGGTIHVTSGFKKTSPQTGEWHIAVKDTGIGIAAENLSEIFDDYIQVARSGKSSEYMGTGLGLAICKRIVNLYNGLISVESTVGKGSTFTVSLPLTISNQAPPQETATVSSPVDLTDKKILIVDDMKINLLVVSKLMDKIGANYELANGGPSAYQLFLANQYDMIITDIQMPEMDGIELSRLVRSHADQVKAKIPIVAFTGDLPDESEEHYRKLGIDAVLPKPFKEEYLRELLYRLL